MSRRSTAGGQGFRIAPNIAKDAAMIRYAYRVPGNEPEAWRRLDVYTIDPSHSKRSGAIANVRIPYEPVGSGPRGVLFAVDTRVGISDTRYRPAALDDPAVLRDGGYRPDPADSRFHCQNVYAIAMHTYEAFRRALGRMTGWPSGTHPISTARRAPCSCAPSARRWPMPISTGPAARSSSAT